jgi:hypothetical protein
MPTVAESSRVGPKWETGELRRSMAFSTSLVCGGATTCRRADFGSVSEVWVYEAEVHRRL